MKKHKFQTVKGISDKLPAQAYSIQKLNRTISKNIEQFGYNLVDTPILEDTDLFLVKSGPDLTRKIFTLATGKKNLCLRPEFTPSMIRMYIEKMQMHPKPVRVYYSGPVFRYEQPGESTHRQFTMTGIELFGASGPAADGEIIGLSYDSLATCGVLDAQLMVGHIGIIGYLLDQFGLDRRSRRFIMTKLENLRKEQLSKAEVGAIPQTMLDVAKLPDIKTAKHPSSPDASITPEVKYAMESMLASVELNANSSRSKQEISERLLLKLRRLDQSERLAGVIELIKEFISIRGNPDVVFKTTPDILHHYQIDPSPLMEFQKTIDSLEAYGIPKENIQIDFGLGRGIHYYTGLVFEIYAKNTGRQLCGGGRYDDMVQILGSSQFTPAAGATIGLERVLQSVKKGKDVRPVSIDVIIIPVGEGDIMYAAQVAQRIRKQTNLIIELDIKPKRNVGRSLNHAARLGIPLVAIVGSEERERQSVVLKKMATREQVTIQLKHIHQIERFLNGQSK